nr:uncharacterized protein LOC107976709 isoform X4 [Pan troglodytes]
MSNKNPNPKEAELKLHSVSRCSEVTCVISFVFRVFLILLFAPRLLTGWRRGKNFHIHIQNVCQNSLRIFMCMVISSEFCIQSKSPASTCTPDQDVERGPPGGVQSGVDLGQRFDSI